MTKTALTMKMEKALYEHTGAGGVGVYGCFEVSLGAGYGNERVDFMTMDSKDEIRCYEIKSSERDFQSEAQLSFVGDYNCLVIPRGLKGKIADNEKFRSLLLHGVGVLLYDADGDRITLCRKAKKRPLTMAWRVELMHCMIRSLSRYCHYEFQSAKGE